MTMQYSVVRSIMSMLLLSLPLAACQDSTGPIRPALRELNFSARVYAASRTRTIAVVAELSSPDELVEGRYIPVRVSTSRGTSVEARILPGSCPDRETGEPVECNAIIVILQPGRTPDDLTDLLARLSGAFVPGGSFAPTGEFVELILNGGKTGRIYFVYDGDLVDAIKAAADHEAVRDASVSPLVRNADAQLRPVRTPTPFAVIPAAPLSNGPHTLQIMPGDVLTVEYVNPDGTLLTATATVQ